MEIDDQFYIGWQDSAAPKYNNGRKRFFGSALVILVLFSGLYLFIENDFGSSFFDYGNLTELEGTVVDYPVFGLRTVLDEKEVTVPLVGFGKFDADPVLEQLRQQVEGNELAGYSVTLRGTLIQYNGKSWMELTEGDASIVSITKSNAVRQKISRTGQLTITGEIVDPKCFFGVMNPAFGKIHKSCAIRCISGGIPPILAVKKNGEYVDYFFLIDEQGNKVNKLVLQHVGETISVTGNTETVDDWNVMKLEVDQLSTKIMISYASEVTVCGGR